MSILSEKAAYAVLLEIPLNYSSGVLYLQLARHLEKMILAGSISTGERLPGTRELARMLRVSRSTVVSAYSLLAEKGLVSQSERSGTYALNPMRHGEKERVDEEALFRFDSESPGRELMPLTELSDIMWNLPIPDLESSLETSPPEGQPTLRRLLLHHAALRGIPAHPDEVVVTSGGKDAISTVMRSLKVLGVSRLWAEELSYGEIPSIARNERLSLRTIPLLNEDSLSCLEGLNEQDALYLVPSFQNPTGRTMPHEMRKIVLSVRRRRGFLILEDDSYGELRYGEKSVSALKAMDEGVGVVYIGSFSQALFPGMRLGYTLLPKIMKETYLSVSSLRQGHVSSLVQSVVTRFLQDGKLTVAVERARTVLSGRMRALASRLEAGFPRSEFFRPEGGIYLWFPTGVMDGAEAAILAAEHGVKVTPGECFALRRMRVPAVRLSIAAVSEASMEDAVARLSRAWDGRLSC
ncbi:MAG: PLP-dependent aminotransferase family protein [Aminobacteriaceae bacterium]